MRSPGVETGGETVADHSRTRGDYHGEIWSGFSHFERRRERCRDHEIQIHMRELRGGRLGRGWPDFENNVVSRYVAEAAKFGFERRGQ